MKLCQAAIPHGRSSGKDCAANAAGAFGEAAASGSPVLLLATEISTAFARPGVRRGVLHETRDQAAIFESLAKAVFRPRTAADVSLLLRLCDIHRVGLV